IWPFATQLPALGLPLVSVLLLAVGGAAPTWFARQLEKTRQTALRIWLFVALLMLITAIGFEWYGQWRSGLRPQDNAYAASVYAMLGLQSIFVGATSYMTLFTVARSLAGKLSVTRRACYDNTMII